MSNDRRWLKEEITIVLYFASRQMTPNAITRLLARRGYCRTSDSVQRMLVRLAVDNPFLRGRTGYWDPRAVDRYIDKLIENHILVNKIIWLSPEDANDIALCQCLDQTVRALESLNTGLPM